MEETNKLPTDSSNSAGGWSLPRAELNHIACAKKRAPVKSMRFFPQRCERPLLSISCRLLSRQLVRSDLSLIEHKMALFEPM
jgi:hypothetical protein